MVSSFADTLGARNQAKSEIELYCVCSCLSQDRLGSALISLLTRFDLSPFLRNTLCTFAEEATIRIDWKNFDKDVAQRTVGLILKQWGLLAADKHGVETASRLFLALEKLLTCAVDMSGVPCFDNNEECEGFLRLCINSDVSRMDSSRLEVRSGLLLAAINSDCALFVPVFFSIYLEDQETQWYKDLFDTGVLDRAFAAALRHGGHALPRKGSLSWLAERLDSRIIPVNAHEQRCRQFFDYIAVCSELTRIPGTLETVSLTGTADILRAALPKLLHHSEYVQLSTRIASSQSSSAVAELASELLLGMLRHFPTYIRSYTRGENTCKDPRLLLLSCCNLLQECQGLSSVLSSESTKSSMQVFVRTMMKIGMGKRIEIQDVRSCCLSVVRALVFHGGTDLFAKEVFDMATTHSQFEILAGSSEPSDQHRKLELMRLLASCLTCSKMILFNESTWSILLNSFRAGTTAQDSFLHLVLKRYGACSQSRAMFLRPVTFGEAIPDDSAEGWGWLIPSIETSRVQATLRNFPVAHTMEQPSLQSLLDPSHVYTESGDGECYAPGLFLRFVLAALEDNKPDRGTRHEPSEQCIALAHGICEKGCLAIALMSLASKCGSTRRISICIITFLIEVIDTEEARHRSSWKERPQILMILQSVRRAFVIRKAHGTEENDETESSVVPRLPGLSAGFLAKASLVLSHTSDRLFPAVNRIFLQNESDHGAFQDLTRLPAFVSLFCSSADDFELLVIERRFALNIVYDGFTDDECYKLLVGCHCIELLMTSLVSVRKYDGVAEKDEQMLVIRILSKIVGLGGEKTMSHLLNRVGLLSYLRSLLLTEVSTCKTMHFQSSIIRLLSTIAEKLADEDVELGLHSTMSGIPEVAMNLAIKSFDLESKSKFHARQARESLRCALSFLSNLARCPVEREVLHSYHGIEIKTATAFLSLVEETKDYDAAVSALCSLPMNAVACKRSDLFQLVVTLLGRVQTGETHCTDLRENVLSRASNLCLQMKLTDAEREMVVKMLLQWRRQCSIVESSRSLWIIFFKSVKKKR